MDQRHIERELADAGGLLESTFAHLAYVAEDGTPRVSPVGVYWTGSQFVVSTAATAPKVASLLAHPDVALSVDGGSAPQETRTLSVRGRADVTFVDGVTQEYLAASRRSMAPEAAAQFEQAVRATYDRMARIAITPHWVRYYHFGEGRLPRFMQELAERSAD